jgi:hypothetical protein
MKIENGRRKTM